MLLEHVPMAVNVEISLHSRTILRVLLAKCVPLEVVRNFFIVIDHPVTRVSLRIGSPLDKLVPVTALHDLVVAKSTLFDRRHKGVVGRAHDVLPQSVKAMVYVLYGCAADRSALSFALSIDVTNDFLYKDQPRETDNSI
jgi:hypothetical protein